MSPAPSSQSTTSQPAGILIVDDTPENLTVLRDILAREGHRVRPVLSGAQALRTASAEPPDLVLLDVMMPVMDGFETCRRLKADPRTRDVPVLFISALDATASKVDGFAAGGLDYIAKPFRAEEVVARVRTHLALYAAQRRVEAANAELREAARLREDVDRLLRHDLRGPLANLIGYAELIAEAPADPATADHARVIARAGYALLSMIHGSFDLLKMERGGYVANPEPFALLEVLRQVAGELALAAGRKRVALTIDDLAGDPVPAGEPLLCRSLFYNLVKNAIEAAPPDAKPDATVTLTATRDDAAGTVQVAVRNPGAVPEALRGRFFTKYATHGKPGGTGLGAYSAQLMAQTQGGTIRLDADEPGHTTITVALPLAGETAVERWRATQAARQPATPAASELPLADVLVADDDPANRALLKRLLPTPPLRPWFAGDGHEALAALQRETPAAALIDLEMPGMDGLLVAAAWREWQRQQPAGSPARARPPVLIALTGHHGEDIAARCREVGFARVLTKPVGRETLLQALAEVLAPPPVAVLDPDLRELIPEFLTGVAAGLDDCAAALAAGDHQRLRSLAHRLQGSLAMHGFAAASKLAIALEQAAQANDGTRAGTLTAELRTHMNRLEIRYG